MNNPGDPPAQSARTGQFQHWRLEAGEADIQWLCLDKADSSTNVLSTAVLLEFAEIVESLVASPPRGLIIYSGKDNGFIAGADVNEFPQLREGSNAVELIRSMQDVLDRLESLPTSVVAVINGFAMGGGLELALACDWRIAFESDRSTLGLPEVQLGVHPGFGGTVRLVRLLGVRQAMPMMLTGKPVRPAKARQIGLVDRTCTGDNWREIAAELAGRQAPARQAPALDRILNAGPIRPFVARALGKQVGKRARREHYPAPYAIIDLWRRYGAKGKAAYEAEAASFAELLASPTSRNLVRVFFLQDRLKRPLEQTLPAAKHVHVVGGGIMGGDIAAWCALKGLSVTLQDREMHYIVPALERAERLFGKKIRNDEDREKTRQRLVADVNGEGVAEADIVIEAIFEDLEAKQALYRQMEPRMKPDAVLASNTSSIPVQDLSSCLQNPGRLVGLHFFNPVAKLPLVEVVSADTTAPGTTAVALAFAQQIGKLPVPCRSHPGFLVNRILAPYMAEAMDLAREGVPIAEIDRVAVSFGMPMGPVELADTVGLDVALHVARILAPVIGRTSAPELEKMVADGHLGRKTGRGFYEYRDDRPIREKPAKPGHYKDVESRLMLAFVNEAAKCLDEEVVSDADLVDAGVIFGTGFAPFRGGPLHYAKERGVNEVVTELERLAEVYGPRFKPSGGWQKLSGL